MSIYLIKKNEKFYYLTTSDNDDVYKVCYYNITLFVFLETILKKALRYCIPFISMTLALFCQFSCSNAPETKLVYTETDTIKQSVREREQTITWTQELEGEVLSERITKDSMKLGPDVVYGRDIYKISKSTQKPVYPSIEGFGSLDTSNLKISVKEKIEKFCEELSSKDYSGISAYFSSKYLFNYVFFIKDFEEGWKKNFSEELPEEHPYFNKWIYGQPFNGVDIIQIPVRFYADCGTIDMTVFLNSGGNNEFYQITIDRWKKV